MGRQSQRDAERDQAIDAQDVEWRDIGGGGDVPNDKRAENARSEQACRSECVVIL
jgi:hypothetical protein